MVKYCLEKKLEVNKEFLSNLKLVIHQIILIPKGKHINFNQGEKIKKGEYLLDGQPYHMIF